MQKVSYIPLREPPRVILHGRAAGSDCLAPVEVRLTEEGVKMVCEPVPFARFAAGAVSAKGLPEGWESACGAPLAVSVLVHAEGKTLVLERWPELAVQSGKCTAGVTGTVRGCDAKGPDALAAAALRELREETGLAEKDGILSFRGLALAPGKLQMVGLFAFAFRGSADDLLRRVSAHSEFFQEHVRADVLNLKEALARPLSPVLRFAVEALFGGAGKVSGKGETVPLLADRGTEAAVVAASALCGVGLGSLLAPHFGFTAAWLCPAALAALAAFGAAALRARSIAKIAERLAGRLEENGNGFVPVESEGIPVRELRPFAELLNAVVSRAREMREALLRLSATDSMTGLFNHREFHRRLGEIVSQGEKVAVACSDLNDLKQVNDRHGHPAGDEVIQLFASVLSDAASRVPGAVPARLGGDEFAVLLPGFGHEAAEHFARSVARDPRLEEGAARYCPGGRVTVGRGVAAYPRDVDDAGLLLARADERMYAHKSNGRNFSAKLASVLARLDGETTLDEAEAVFEALLGLIDGLDRGLASHSRRVAKLAREVATRMGLPPEEVRLAEIAGKFHDIGKLSVGPSVLRKKGPLTDEEKKLIERHPVLGADMLSAVAAMKDVALAVRHHHERWDGTGYPDGLEGEEIPLLSRILAACEVFDAMTRAEFPRRGYAPEAALKEMCASKGFDLWVVEALEFVAGREKAECGSSSREFCSLLR